jgi:hypothetical protein
MAESVKQLIHRHEELSKEMAVRRQPCAVCGKVPEGAQMLSTVPADEGVVLITCGHPVRDAHPDGRRH